MRCVYINLERATARRAALEASFAAAPRPGWELVRFPAIDADAAAGIAGRLTPPEKGCFASHRAALASTLDDDEAVVILEDDASFSPRSFALIDRVLAAGSEWDVMFLDLTFTEPNALVRYAKQWNGLKGSDSFLLDDLSRTKFDGAGAYVVRGPSKAKVFELLCEGPLDVGYDVRLRELCHAGTLRMRVCFPFLVQMSPEAANSQIRNHANALEQTFRNLRRLMFVDRDIDQATADAEALKASFQDPGALAFGVAMAAIVSDAFPGAW